MKSARILVLPAILLLAGCARTTEPLVVGFWNVENLFDLEDDPATSDEEFARGGRKNVTPEILDLKLEHLAQVLADMDADVVGLAEVENRAVLEMLNARFPARNYSIVHYDSPDERGIDVALLYDPARFELRESVAITVDLGSAGPTRDILRVTGRYGGVPLYLFVNHWPSHYGGTEATIPLRASAAGTLRREVDKLLQADQQAEILIMGDLNDVPTAPSVSVHLGATLDKQRVGAVTDEQAQPVLLWNMSGPFEGRVDGATYKYRGQDENLDQIIVSPGLIDAEGLAVVDNSITIIDLPRYRQQEGDYRGYPFRFWAGDRLLGGYSDHLAVRVAIEWK